MPISLAGAPGTELPKLEIVGISDRQNSTIANHSPIDPSTLNPIDSTLHQLIESTLPTFGKVARPTSNPTLSASSVLQIWQDIELLHQQQPSAEIELGNAYFALGNIYRMAIGLGESNATYLKIAIAAYEKTFKLREKQGDKYRSLCYELANDIGNFYWMLCRVESNVSEQVSNLEQAIAAYEKSLSKLNAARQSEAWAMVQNNLGTVYNELSRHRSPVQYLQLSIKAYREVLRYRPNLQTLQQSILGESEKIAKIQGFAATQNNLATAYWNLAQHEEALKNLQQAISAYIEALIALESQLHSNQSPQWVLNYAMIQNNLGTGYWNLAQYENPEDNLQLAIDAYHIALMYRTPNAAPVACAATQNNLGTAYTHLAKYSAQHSQKRSEYLRQAIAAYSTALEIAQQLQKIAKSQTANSATPVNSPVVTFDLLATHNNLGKTYYQVAIESDSEIHSDSVKTDLDRALQHHLQAYNGWQEKSQPDLAKKALIHVVQSIRGFYNFFGTQGQNQALSQVPGHLLPEVMPRL